MFVIWVGLGLAPAAYADETTCGGYSKAMGGSSFKAVETDKEKMAEKFGVPKCVDVTVCFVFRDSTKYRVDVGVIIGNSCDKPFDVAVWLPKKAKGSTDPDAESVSSTDPKKKNMAGSNKIAPGKSYTFGTISAYSREFPVDAILFKVN